MALTDPIADMLTRIRNAAHAGHESVGISHSKIKEAIARLLYNEGFVGAVDVVGEGIRKQIVVALKYSHHRKPVFTAMERASKPGRRMYVKHKDIRAMRQGMGVAILTTPRGVMTDTEAKRQGVGGEVMCTIW